MSELENVLDTNPLRPTRRFMTVAFAVGTVLGFVVSFAFYKYLVIVGHWDMKVHLFPTILFFWGLAFAVPMGSITVRVMYLTLVMGYAGLEQYQKLSVQFKEAQDDLKKAHEELKKDIRPLLDKANVVLDQVPPMVEDIKVVLEKARAMGDDVVSIAHRVNTATHELNGSFNVKVLEAKLDVLGKSLATIAKAFGGENGEIKEPEILEFDPTKLAARKRR